MNGIKRIQQEMKDKGYNAQMTAIPIYFITYETKDKNTKSNIMSWQNRVCEILRDDFN